MHFFKNKAECEEFFGRMAKNDGEELTLDYIFEGNSSRKYGWIQQLGDLVGYENIGVEDDRFSLPDIDFVDEIYINLKTAKWGDVTKVVWIDGDEIYIDTDGGRYLYGD